MIFNSTGKTKPQWADFLMTTTLSGLIQIHISTKIPKIVWMVVFILLSAATVWNTLPMISEVSSYPIQYLVSDFEAPDDVAPFPAVSIYLPPQIDCLTLASAYI